MKNKLCMLMCIIYVFCFTFFVSAVAIDTDKLCTLSLNYIVSGNKITNHEIRIYQIADVSEDGTFSLTDNFDEYQVKTNGLSTQREKRVAAQTLSSYVNADRVAAAKALKTDSQGKVTFESLKTGMYLVMCNDAYTVSGTYTFEPFLIILPYADDSGKLYYDMSVNPKSGAVTPFSRYSVTKLWKDSQSDITRPESVSVDITKDGEVWKSVTLSAENNWTYTWESPDESSEWSVVERNVAEGYIVSITEIENTFTIVNSTVDEPPGDEPTEDIPPEEPPKSDVPPSEEPETEEIPKEPVPQSPYTGDPSEIWKYIIIMAISGVALVLSGLTHKREC